MKLFSIHRKKKEKFTYQSDAQLIETLINKKDKQQQQDAFDYVFNKYEPSLKSLVKSTFKVSEEEAERALKKLCAKLQSYLLSDEGAKLKLYNPDDSPFESWFARKSQTFFKEYIKENTVLFERYRKGDHAIVFERYENDFKQKIYGGKKDADIIEKESKDLSRETKDLSQDLYMHLFNNNYQKLNQYHLLKGSFDEWFRGVLENYSIDLFRKRTKKSNEDVYDSISSKKVGGRIKKSDEGIRSNIYSEKDDDLIEQCGLFRIDNQDTSPGWEKGKLDTDDEERKKIIEFVREVMVEILSHRDYNILVDYYFNGMEYAEITEKYNVKIGNLYNIIRRAIERLREKIKEYGYKTK